MLDDTPAEIRGRRAASVGALAFVTHISAVTGRVSTSRSCTSSPPLTLTYWLGIASLCCISTSSSRRFFFVQSTSSAPSVTNWRHDDLQENRLHQFGRLARYGAVRGDDTAEDRHLVGLVSLRPGIHDIPPDGSTAGIHMFEPHAERLIELAHDAQRGVGILYIIVRHLLAVELPGIGQRIGHLVRRCGRTWPAGADSLRSGATEPDRTPGTTSRRAPLFHACR